MGIGGLVARSHAVCTAVDVDMLWLVQDSIVRRLAPTSPAFKCMIVLWVSLFREEEAKSLGAKTGLHTRTTPISTQPQHCRSVQG
uniref:Uncharacterized protein n=1 Tax=Timema monikensis TaxID=170555 RepID=A0A7R9HIB5_9NEOP|nr:unnamed protein product [Timema monikensis]